MPFFPPGGGGTAYSPGNGIDITGATIAAPPPPNTFWAGPGGSDAHDGSSWADRTKTAAKAVQLCETAGGGTVYIADGTWASDVTFDGGTKSAGLWLSGISDLGIGGPGWIDTTTTMALVGVAANGSPLGFGKASMVPGGGATAWKDSIVQACGMQGGLTFQNLYQFSDIPGKPAWRIGLSSPLAPYDPAHTYGLGICTVSGGISYISAQAGNTGHTPVSNVPTWWIPLRPGINDGLAPSITAFVNAYNCSMQQAGDLAGPGCDVGFMFFSDWANNEYHHYYATTDNDLLNCSIRAFASPNTGGVFTGSYDWTMTNCRMNIGGMYCYGGNSIVMNNIVGENMVMANWHGVADTSLYSPTGAPFGSFTGVQNTDSSAPYALINNGGNMCLAVDCGPQFGPFINNAYNANSTMGMGQVGRIGAVSLMQQDSARRSWGFSASPYPNIAYPLEQFGGATWVAGPDGAAAGLHSAKAYNGQHKIYESDNIRYGHPNVGDHLLWGLWVNFYGSDPTNQGFTVSNGGTGPVSFTAGSPATGLYGTMTLAGGEHTEWLPNVPLVKNKWIWVSAWIKITNFDAAGALTVVAAPSLVLGKSRPWLIRVPAADGLSDDAVRELWLHAYPTPQGYIDDSTMPASPTAGFPAAWPWQTLSMWDATLKRWATIKIDNGAIVLG